MFLHGRPQDDCGPSMVWVHHIFGHPCDLSINGYSHGFMAWAEQLGADIPRWTPWCWEWKVKCPWTIVILPGPSALFALVLMKSYEKRGSVMKARGTGTIHYYFWRVVKLNTLGGESCFVNTFHRSHAQRQSAEDCRNLLFDYFHLCRLPHFCFTLMVRGCSSPSASGLPLVPSATRNVGWLLYVL